MSNVKMPIGKFVAELEAALERKDGYIMGSRGQNPRTGYLIDVEGQKPKSVWKEDGWWFDQYLDSKQRHDKALYWRKNAARVWDCNGMAEGIYEIFSGININSKARYNYSDWCSPKAKGTIPANKRVPGAAVFWGSKASSIHHVGYLYKPVDANNPSGDWYIIEARGVMYGVVKTKLYDRDPDFWGYMTKYFDYSEYGEEYTPVEPQLGDVILRNGDEDSSLVKQMQANLIRLGYDCGKWGADGDFGDATELALMKFQRDHNLDDDGQYGPLTHAAMEAAISALNKPVEYPKSVKIEGGDCWVRSAPDKTDPKNRLGVAHRGDILQYGGQTSEEGWHLVAYKNQNGWVSGKYSKLVNE